MTLVAASNARMTLAERAGRTVPAGRLPLPTDSTTPLLRPIVARRVVQTSGIA